MIKQQLDPKTVYEMVEELQSLPDCRVREVALRPIARMLMRLCRGAFYKGEYWSPERQARWVIDQALLWTRWPGPGGIRKIFEDRWPLPSDL